MVNESPLSHFIFYVRELCHLSNRQYNLKTRHRILKELVPTQRAIPFCLFHNCNR